MSSGLISRGAMGIRSTLRIPRLNNNNSLPIPTVSSRVTPLFVRLESTTSHQATASSPTKLPLPLNNPDDWFLYRRARHGKIGLKHKERRMQLDVRALRDSCDCDKCVDPHSGQKNFGTTEVPHDLPVQSFQRLGDGSLEIVWENDFFTSDSHRTVFSPSTVRSWLTITREGHPWQSLPVPTLWDRQVFAARPSTFRYDDWISGGPKFHEALAQLHNYGLVFLDGVPKSEDSVVSIATQVGLVMETFYGRTWDVRSKPQAENVAYTSTFLGLHQDLLYTADPPRLQFLHCLENSCTGGESIFSDSLRAATFMKFGPADLYNSLLQRKIRYHYKKDGHFYEKLRPVLSSGGGVFWSPPFQSPEQPMSSHISGSYNMWLKAAKTFRGLLEDEEWLYERKLEPGQCVIFDNLRVMHGRRRFDTSSGSRWLKGTYVSSDEWLSKRAILAQEIADATVSSRRTLDEQANEMMVPGDLPSDAPSKSD